ncbi:MAG: precorrin-2 C(20)-methyltransferase [Alphaproteobacteria bacterium]|nr:precorrin-2 C(20)-methyltransferase [Alphaproteobacteria bacterium]
MKGQLHGVGVGPGDPDLITLKALKVLQAADVIAYPALEEGGSLARAIAAPHIPEGKEEFAIRMPMLVDRFPAMEVYDQAAERIGASLEAGKSVAVLCEGDPFFYGSFMYLFGRLAERHPVEVIPGISSLMACAAALSAPLAARNDVLTILPAPLEDAVLEARLAASDSVAIVKVGRHFERVRALLERLGLADEASYVERATMEKQRVLSLRDVNASAVPYFSMILVHRRGRAWS